MSGKRFAERERERKVLDDYKYDNGFVVLFFFVIPTFLTYTNTMRIHKTFD